MSVKAKYGLSAVLLTGFLFACHSVHLFPVMVEKQLPSEDSVRVIAPEFIPEVQVNKPLTWLLPLTHLEDMEAVPYRGVNITENFCEHDINHVSSTDPKLFAESDKMQIDLLQLQQKSNYSFPLPGAKVISPFGGSRRNHSGVDLKTFAGDTIRAAFDGIVRMAKSYAGYGNVIVIRHFNGLETVYSHNSKHLVSQGCHVKAGQPIALTGRTGRATTDHLHFETRIDGRPFNPALLFDMDSQCLQSNILLCTKQNNNINVSSMQRFPL